MKWLLSAVNIFLEIVVGIIWVALYVAGVTALLFLAFAFITAFMR